jgi:hypothetical protein
MRLSLWTLPLALLVNAPGAHAQEPRSTKVILPHCMAGVAPDSQDVIGGRCAGIVATLTFVSRVLPDNLKFCQPGVLPPEEVVKAIAKFAEANPDTADQDFRLVALAAMREAWPCQE